MIRLAVAILMWRIDRICGIPKCGSKIGTGAIFPTTTKVKTVLTPVSRLNDVCRSVPIPVVAIGGLNAGNMDVLNGSPIDGIAVVSAIMKSADPEAAARELFARVRVIKENNR